MPSFPTPKRWCGKGPPRVCICGPSDGQTGGESAAFPGQKKRLLSMQVQAQAGLVLSMSDAHHHPHPDFCTLPVGGGQPVLSPDRPVQAHSPLACSALRETGWAWAEGATGRCRLDICLGGGGKQQGGSQERGLRERARRMRTALPPAECRKDQAADQRPGVSLAPPREKTAAASPNLTLQACESPPSYFRVGNRIEGGADLAVRLICSPHLRFASSLPQDDVTGSDLRCFYKKR